MACAVSAAQIKRFETRMLIFQQKRCSWTLYRVHPRIYFKIPEMGGRQGGSGVRGATERAGGYGQEQIEQLEGRG